jgi:hypothetical protein
MTRLRINPAKCGIVAVVAAAACGLGCVTVTKVPAPNGAEALLIKCPAEEQCMNRAAEECGGPYEIIKSGSDTSVSGSGGNVNSSTTHSLTVQCKNAKPGT